MEIKRTATITLTAQSPKISVGNVEEYAALLNDLFNDMLHNLSLNIQSSKYIRVHLDEGEIDTPKMSYDIKITFPV